MQIYSRWMEAPLQHINTTGYRANLQAGNQQNAHIILSLQPASMQNKLSAPRSLAISQIKQELQVSKLT